MVEEVRQAAEYGRAFIQPQHLGVDAAEHANVLLECGIWAHGSRRHQSDILSLSDDNLVFTRNLFEGIPARLLAPCGDLFSRIRMVHRKTKPQGRLLKEFKRHVSAIQQPQPAQCLGLGWCAPNRRT
jgi:hypothetical protein